MRVYTLNKSQLGLVVSMMKKVEPESLREVLALNTSRLESIQGRLREEERLVFEISYVTVSRILDQVNQTIKILDSMPVITDEQEHRLGELSDLKVVLKRHFQVV